MPAQTITAGQWIDGYQTQAQAPVSWIAGSKTVEWNGHLITGSWSNPWWAFNPDTQAWAVVKVLKVKAQTVLDWIPNPGAGWTGGHYEAQEVPASVTFVTVPVNAAGVALEVTPAGSYYALAA